MQFSPRAIQILRNFSTIHQALQFKPGRVLKVISESKSVLAEATIDCDIEKEFAIYDVPKFLSAISMFEDPVITPQGAYVEIRQSNENINWNCAEPSLILSPPVKRIELPTIDVEFDLKDETINRVLKGMAITGANALCITGEDGNIFLEARTNNSAKNQGATTGAPTYRAEVGATDKKFCFIIVTDNFKLLPGDYTVCASKGGIAHFKGTDIEYWVAVESNSSFDG